MMFGSIVETLDSARDWLRDRVDEGVHCPCCGQFAKVYNRTINKTQARALIRFYLASQQVGVGEFLHLASIAGPACEGGKLRYWGLLENEATTGGRRAYWRLTPAGYEYVRGTLAVPKYARIYNGELVELDGPLLTIRDALKNPFDYDVLMGRK